MTAYVECKGLPELCAQQIDDSPITEIRRKTPTVIEFCADVEMATERILGGNPTLERGWFRIACGERVEPDIANEVYRRCGRTYFARELQPWLYFRRNKYPHRRNQDEQQR
jgi:hypothetical protein